MVSTADGTVEPPHLRALALAAGGYGLAVTPFVMAAWIAQSELYLVAGRMFFPAYVGAAAGLWLLDRRLGAVPHPLARGALWLALAALGVGLVGDLGSYYGGGGHGAGVPFTSAQLIFYSAVEFPAVAAAQLAVALYGIGLARSGAVERRTAWAVAALGPAGLVLWPLHIPSGPLFVINAYLVASAAGRGPAPDRAP